MRKIAVTGGKGGVGKSTVAVLLANKYLKKNKRVVLVDCDVECPNDYLLLGQKLGRPVKKVYANFPQLNKQKCIKCGQCAVACRSNAIFQPKNKYPLFIEELCSACGTCGLVCPNNAIGIKKKETGKIFVNKIKNSFWIITGLSRSRLEETGPVVTQTKEFAEKFAQAKKVDLILIDIAPGTHCPVISALLGVDYAYPVTEPTPMGAHDLSLILDLLKKLKIKAKPVLNQSDLGKKQLVEDVLEKFKIKKFDQEIKYSKDLAKAYSTGNLLNFNH